MTFDTDVRGPQRIKANNFYDPLTFHLAPPWGWLLWLSSYWMDCHQIWLFISRHNHIQKFQYFGFWPNTSKAKDFPISLKQWTFLTSALALWACWCYHLARSVAVPEYSLSELPAWLWTSFFTIDEMKKKEVFTFFHGEANENEEKQGLRWTERHEYSLWWKIKKWKRMTSRCRHCL